MSGREETPDVSQGQPVRLHDLAPENPSDGDRFTCSCCGYTCTYVVLDDGLPGEWVD